MKKTLLLASAACIIATSANAKMWNNFDPYIGADYAYDNLNLKGDAKYARKNFNSAKINLGTDITQYSSWEAFYQFGGSRKAHLKDSQGGGTKKFKFNAYGLDGYGYMPLGCEQKFSLVGTLGAAVYDTELKHKNKITKSRVGYRIGGGAQYKITDNISARVIGRYSHVGTRDLKHLAEVTAGVRYSF